jgi:hypothetical protein
MTASSTVRSYAIAFLFSQAAGAVLHAKAMLIKVTAGMRPAYDKPMKKQTHAMADDQNTQYELYRKPTKRDAFFSTMEQIIPWAELCSVIESHYPKGSVTEAIERLTNRTKSRGRACVRRSQTALGLRQGALPRSVQERYSRIRCGRPGQYPLGAQAAHGMSASA